MSELHDEPGIHEDTDDEARCMINAIVRPALILAISLEGMTLDTESKHQVLALHLGMGWMVGADSESEGTSGVDRTGITSGSLRKVV